MSIFRIVDYPILCNGLRHFQEIAFSIGFQWDIATELSASSETQVTFLSTESIGMLSDRFWKIGILNDIRPNLRAQLTPMIR